MIRGCTQGIIIVMGDFNSKVGEGRTSDVIGSHGLGERNKRGDILEVFAVTNNIRGNRLWLNREE